MTFALRDVPRRRSRGWRITPYGSCSYYGSIHVPNIDSIASGIHGLSFIQRHAVATEFCPVTTLLETCFNVQMADFARYFGRAIWSFSVGTGCGDFARFA